jgi:hypothetical protein
MLSVIMFNVIMMSVTAPILHFQKSIVGQLTGRNYFSLNLFLDLSEFFCFVQKFFENIFVTIQILFLFDKKFFFHISFTFFMTRQKHQVGIFLIL